MLQRDDDVIRRLARGIGWIVADGRDGEVEEAEESLRQDGLEFLGREGVESIRESIDVVCVREVREREGCVWEWPSEIRDRVAETRLSSYP